MRSRAATRATSSAATCRAHGVLRVLHVRVLYVRVLHVVGAPSFVPQMTELRGHQVAIGYGLADQAAARRKLHQAVDRLVGYVRLVEWRVTRDQAGDQLRLVGGEKFS